MCLQAHVPIEATWQRKLLCVLSDLAAGVKFRQQLLTKRALESVEPGQEAVSDPLQAAGLERPRRRIQPTAHLRLGIKKALQTFQFQGAVAQAERRLAAYRLTEPPIAPVTVQHPRTSPRAARALPVETSDPSTINRLES